jgi:pimeloyl-ACP methyl ester carboxylesterase
MDPLGCAGLARPRSVGYLSGVASSVFSAVHPLITRRSPGRARPAPLVDPAALPARDPHQRPWPGREVSAGGVVLHVRETPGPDDVDAVYVHGLSGSATNWTDLAGLLSTRATGIAVDLPGFGRSRPPSGALYTPAAHADALLCFLAGRGRPVHLLGNSMGGAIALAVAARRPELVRTLTLVSPAMPDLRPDPRRVSNPQILLALLPVVGRGARAALAAQSPRERAEQVMKLCFGDPSIAAEHRIDELAQEYAERAGQPWGYEAARQSGVTMVAGWLRGESLWRVAGRIRVPTLVVWGDRDRLVAPRLAARTTAAIPGARLLMLPGVGHVAQIEAPVEVARAVAALWDGTWEDPASDGR